MSPASLARRRRVALTALLLGVVVMVAFDRWFTLLAGLVLMLGAVVEGLFLVAAPDGFLDHDHGDDAEDRDTASGPGSAEHDRPVG